MLIERYTIQARGLHGRMRRISVNITDRGIYLYGALQHFDYATFEHAALTILKDVRRDCIVVTYNEANWVAAVDG